ncbi:hypothetical protein ACHAXT_009640 [Thalassiosira profunda]
MVAIVSSSAVDLLVKTKGARSESVDSLSSTFDVHAGQSSKQTGVSDDTAAKQCKFGLVDEGDALPSPENQRLRDALSSIVVLDSASRPDVKSLLDAYDGHLLDVGTGILEGLRSVAPSSLAARVGDYNENLCYEMQDLDRGIGSIIQPASEEEDSIDSTVRTEIESFEESIRQSLQRTNMKYRGSFMQTERTMFQPAHVDYDYPLLRRYGNRLFLAFFPLTNEGTFLQLWQEPTKTNDDDERSIVEGTVVYIPYGKMLVVPSATIHGGGFKRGPGGNLRFHLYIEAEDDADAEGAEGGEEAEEIKLLDHPMNRYTEEHDRRRELCERFVDANGLDDLLGAFFDP